MAKQRPRQNPSPESTKDQRITAKMVSTSSCLPRSDCACCAHAVSVAGFRSVRPRIPTSASVTRTAAAPGAVVVSGVPEEASAGAGKEACVCESLSLFVLVFVLVLVALASLWHGNAVALRRLCRGVEPSQRFF